MATTRKRRRRPAGASKVADAAAVVVLTAFITVGAVLAALGLLLWMGLL